MEVEGFVGIYREGQWVNDWMFATLLCLFICFALIFRSHFRLSVKMVRDIVQVKERQSLFEQPVGNQKGNEWIFRLFMTFQALFLSAIALFAVGRAGGFFVCQQASDMWIIIGGTFLLLLLFYFFKQGIYIIFGWVFLDNNLFSLWRTSYHATIGFWGVSLYLPVLWLLFTDSRYTTPAILYIILYILCRFVIFYKTLRIFHIKSDGFIYLILYLCAQEILPLFLFYKGSVYLYNFIEMSILWR